MPLNLSGAVANGGASKKDSTPPAVKNPPFAPTGPRKVGKTDAEKFSKQVTKDISNAKCSASVQGKGRASQPCLTVDGLDGAAYVSEVPVKKGDWFNVELAEASTGTFYVKTGHCGSKDILIEGTVETSCDGQTWKRRGKFSRKTGECEFRIKDDVVKFIRILPTPRTPQILVVGEVTLK